MDILTVIDNELVPVYLTDNGTKIVDGRELHAVLQSKQDFSTWVKKRLNECDAVENKDYELNHNFVEQASGTKHRIDYTILLDTAKEMAMLERNAKGKQVRRYFIKVDEKYKEEKSAPLTLQQQIQTIAKGTDELYSRMDGLENRFTKFEQELPMLPDDADEVHDCLNKRVVFLLGGKERNAYRNKSLSKKVFMDAYRALKYNFNVSRYKAIKRNQKAQALQIIAEYKPPLFLAEQIESVNAQNTLDI